MVRRPSQAMTSEATVQDEPGTSRRAWETLTSGFAWVHVPALEQEDCEFDASLVYRVRLS